MWLSLSSPPTNDAASARHTAHGARQGLSKPNLSSREIDEMIDDWTPEPLVPPLSEEETAEAEARPVCAYGPVVCVCVCVCVCVPTADVGTAVM